MYALEGQTPPPTLAGACVRALDLEPGSCVSLHSHTTFVCAYVCLACVVVSPCRLRLASSSSSWCERPYYYYKCVGISAAAAAAAAVVTALVMVVRAHTRF